MWLLRYTTDWLRCLRIWRWLWVVTYAPPVPALLLGPCSRVLAAVPPEDTPELLPTPPIPPGGFVAFPPVLWGDGPGLPVLRLPDDVGGYGVPYGGPWGYAGPERSPGSYGTPAPTPELPAAYVSTPPPDTPAPIPVPEPSAVLLLALPLALAVCIRHSPWR